jgi:hypothetical protein
MFVGIFSPKKKKNEGDPPGLNTCANFRFFLLSLTLSCQTIKAVFSGLFYGFALLASLDMPAYFRIFLCFLFRTMLIQVLMPVAFIGFQQRIFRETLP